MHALNQSIRLLLSHPKINNSELRQFQTKLQKFVLVDLQALYKRHKCNKLSHSARARSDVLLEFKSKNSITSQLIAVCLLKVI